MNILFTICGRAGSKGFRNKNLKELKGIPLVYYTLAAIACFQEAHPGHRIAVVLNTDSDDLKRLVEKQHILDGVRYCERKDDLAGDVVPKVDVIRDTYLTVKKEQTESFDAVVDVDITSPFRREEDITGVLETLSLDGEMELAFSVVPSRRSPYFNMVEQKHDGYYRRICKAAYTARQQAPVTYEMNASIYAFRPAMLEKKLEGTILDYSCGVFVMPDYLVLDIDSEEDFELMNCLLPYHLEHDAGLKKVFDKASMWKDSSGVKG